MLLSIQLPCVCSLCLGACSLSYWLCCWKWLTEYALLCAACPSRQASTARWSHVCYLTLCCPGSLMYSGHLCLGAGWASLLVLWLCWVGGSFNWYCCWFALRPGRRLGKVTEYTTVQAWYVWGPGLCSPPGHPLAPLWWARDPLTLLNTQCRPLGLPVLCCLVL